MWKGWQGRGKGGCTPQTKHILVLRRHSPHLYTPVADQASQRRLMTPFAAEPAGRGGGPGGMIGRGGRRGGRGGEGRRGGRCLAGGDGGEGGEGRGGGGEVLGRAEGRGGERGTGGDYGRCFIWTKGREGPAEEYMLSGLTQSPIACPLSASPPSPVIGMHRAAVRRQYAAGPHLINHGLPHLIMYPLPSPSPSPHPPLSPVPGTHDALPLLTHSPPHR